jgi:hypothetical protein
MAFVQFCWIVTAIVTMLAAVFLGWGMTVANGAPQEAAIAASAAAAVIVPYVFTRCMEGLIRGYPIRVWVDNDTGAEERLSTAQKDAAQ